jgi:hypothetical protein
MNTRALLRGLAVLSCALVLPACAKWNNDKAVLSTPLSAASANTAIAIDAARLTWTAPVENTDNSPLTDLAGFKVRYCVSVGPCPGGVYTTTVDVGNVSTHTLTSLASGTYRFVVAAYDTAGNDGPNSAEVSKVIP